VTAVFSALVLRSGEHPLVRLVLAPYRLCLAAATLAAVLAAATLAFRAGGGVLGWSWGLGALVAALAAGILSEEAARAPSTRERF
jgi:Fe2+ transport system protein B